jgi:SAM-dependent methyltransferase
MQESTPPPSPTVHTHPFDQVAHYYNTVLNKDKTTFSTKNDESTPIELVGEMIDQIPPELWMRPDLKILDPCCGNGNFALPIYHRILGQSYPTRSPKQILEETLYMTDINPKRLANVRAIYGTREIVPSVKQVDFLTSNETLVQKLGHFPRKYDLIIANPPYAKIDADGKRSAKNHNMIRPFVIQCLSLLARDGYLVLLIPDNWMSKSDRNDLCLTITQLQMVYLDIHTAKRHFRGVGSSFTWFVAQNTKIPVGQTMTVAGVWRGGAYVDTEVPCMMRSYLPLLYGRVVQSILEKTVERGQGGPTIGAAVSCEFHRTTKKAILSDCQTGVFCHRVVHTPTQTLWASRAHALQGRVKIFISITDKYSVWVDAGVSGMTQAVLYVLCGTVAEAEVKCAQLRHPLFVFLNNICRWGKFNNIRVIQSFPEIPTSVVDEDAVYAFFGLDASEIAFVRENL